MLFFTVYMSQIVARWGQCCANLAKAWLDLQDLCLRGDGIAPGPVLQHRVRVCCRQSPEQGACGELQAPCDSSRPRHEIDEPRE